MKISEKMKKCIVLLVLFMVAAYGDMAAASDSITYGGAFRLRQEYWQDIFDLNVGFLFLYHFSQAQQPFGRAVDDNKPFWDDRQGFSGR